MPSATQQLYPLHDGMLKGLRNEGREKKKKNRVEYSVISTLNVEGVFRQKHKIIQRGEGVFDCERKKIQLS